MLRLINALINPMQVRSVIWTSIRLLSGMLSALKTVSICAIQANHNIASGLVRAVARVVILEVEVQGTSGEPELGLINTSAVYMISSDNQPKWLPLPTMISLKHTIGSFSSSKVDVSLRDLRCNPVGYALYPLAS